MTGLLLQVEGSSIHLILYSTCIEVLLDRSADLFIVHTLPVLLLSRLG